MLVGFIHGVMNTDNTALSGETIDFGPCAFMDSYDPATAFSAIDEFGRYAYGNQPTIAQWNLARFAETLLPLLDPNPEQAVDACGLRRSPRLRRAFRSIGLPACGTSSDFPAMRKAISRLSPRLSPSDA